MPSDIEAYNEAMTLGYDAALQHNWMVAATAFSRALHEFPNDTDAHLYLGYSLLEANRLEESLRVYARAHQLAPEDPIALEKSADVLERLGRLRQAAEQYANVAQLYLKQRDIDKAIANWERATQLTPGLLAVHARLAQAYKRLGNRKKGVYQFLMVAHGFSRNGDAKRAREAVMAALELNKKDPTALNMLRALDTGATLIAPQAPADDAPPAATTANAARVAVPAATTIGDPMGPMGESMTDALGYLAVHVMDADLTNAGSIDALQGMELQRQGQHQAAADAYMRATRTLPLAALKFNLGAMLLLVGKPSDAVRPLEEAAADEALAIGAQHALAQAFYNEEKYKRAFRTLVACLQAIDEADAPALERAEVGQVYRALLGLLNERGERDDMLSAACKRLFATLTGEGWRPRVSDMRRQLAEMLREGGPQAMLELLAETTGNEVTESVARIDRYIRQANYTLAMDEAHYLVERAPTYLPIHVRMAEVMMREGRVRQAISKYNTVAKTYMARGENARAASILFEVLEMAPLDVPVRRSLIQLLEEESRWEETLDQMTALSDTYRQLGDLDVARSTYTEAERIALRINAPVEKQVRIKHAMADIDLLRNDLRRAQRTYEQIVELAPNDERARRQLVDLHYVQKNVMEAIRQLDELLRILAKRKQVLDIVRLLEQLVNQHKADPGLRNRLAAIYRQLGRKKEAVQQLDALADIQLNAGQSADACETIRAIVRLGPPNAEDYQQMLQQLNC